MSTAFTDEPEIILQRSGRVGRVILNRPAALNALTHGMILALAEALETWEHDDAIACVLLTGAGERGLCAGGDIVEIYRDAQSGGHASAKFWRDEYLLNARISTYPKPYIAIMDGVVLGGGVGISAHAEIRVVTERSRIGMPETGIGFVPDVGGTYLLSRAPGEVGTHLGLTGAHMGAADAIWAGFADHFVPSADLPALVDALTAAPAPDADALVRRFAVPAPDSPLAAQRDWIDAAYRGGDVLAILDRLEASEQEPARRAAELLRAKSPTAITTTLAALRRAATLGTLEEVLDQEYRVSLAALGWPDLAEGIRAQLIDKDRNPAWDPATLADVDRSEVERSFAQLGDRELGLGRQAGRTSPAGATGTGAH